MVNKIVSIPGYVHLYRSLLRFYHSSENEIKEMLYVLNTANLDCFGYYHPEICVVQSGPALFSTWLDNMSYRPYRTEVQLHKALGAPENRRPFRAHDNDAGADVYMPYDCTIKPGEIAKIPLGFGIEVPDGYAAFVFPRTSMAVKGLVCELPPVDSGYRGEIHAIISNVGDKQQSIRKGARIGQLIIIPVIISDYVFSRGEQRGTGGFGSTGE